MSTNCDYLTIFNMLPTSRRSIVGHRPYPIYTNSIINKFHIEDLIVIFYQIICLFTIVYTIYMAVIHIYNCSVQDSLHIIHMKHSISAIAIILRRSKSKNWWSRGIFVVNKNWMTPPFGLTYLMIIKNIINYVSFILRQVISNLAKFHIRKHVQNSEQLYRSRHLI